MDNNIPFNEWSRNKILLGIKVCTSRHKKYVTDKRVTWISPKLPWWFIKRYLWYPEGAENPEALQKIINEIYKREVPDTEGFYVHFGNFKEEIPTNDKIRKVK